MFCKIPGLGGTSWGPENSRHQWSTEGLQIKQLSWGQRGLQQTSNNMTAVSSEKEGWERESGRHWGRETETVLYGRAAHHSFSSSHLLEGSQWVPHTKGGAYTKQAMGLAGGRLEAPYCRQVYYSFLNLKLFCLLLLCIGTCTRHSMLPEVRG